MTYRNFTRLLLAGAAFSLVACGGGGGGGINSTPPPPVTPPPPPPPPPTTAAIIAGATTSQEFAVKGATGTSTAADQIRIRYDAAANAYEVQLPSSGTWERLTSFGPDSFQSASIPQLNVQRWIGPGYEYSALAEVLFGNGVVGAVAFGIPTPAGAVPTTGSATFNGSLWGQTNETYFDGLFGEMVPGWIYGDIGLSFNFGAGTLAGSISPELYLGDFYALPTMQFTNTVYSTGSSTFSGSFGTALTGTNSFSGLFTGPAAQELIGNLAFPYTSPVDNKNYQAAGAFVAKKQ